MNNRHISIDALNEKLFATIEMLHSNNDDNASKNEKIDVETAKTIASLGKVVIEGYKVKAQVINMLQKTDNPDTTSNAATHSGILGTTSPGALPG